MYKTNTSPRGSSNFLKRNFLEIPLMSLLFLIFSSCSVVPEEAYSTPWNGFTSERPPQVNGVYIITKAEHLSWLSIIIIIETKVRFDANIDMNNKNFAGIKYFKGTMDGNGHSIKNLKIDISGTAGLTQELGNNSTIQNFTIESGSIKGNGDAGAFVGKLKNSATLKGLTNKASIEADFSAGGIIGVNDGTIEIKNTQNFGTVTGNNAGGIIAWSGDTSRSKIKNAQNFGTITGTGKVGGMIGNIQGADSVIIDNAQNSGNVFGGSTGGMIGSTSTDVEIDNAKNSGNITATAGSSGGMIGDVIAITPITINNAKNSGTITASDFAGGMIGFIAPGVIPVINNTENSGTLKGKEGSEDLIGNE